MKRNPLLTDVNGIPLCWGRAEESDTTCMEDCPSDLRDRCIDETCTDGDRNPLNIDPNSEKPHCFGKGYSQFSNSCQEECGFSNDCRLETKQTNKEENDSNSVKTWLSEARKDAASDRIRLPVLQSNPAPSVISPPVKAPPPVNYWETQYNKPYSSYSQPTTTNSNLQLPINRPNLTEEQYLHFYGHKPAANPIIPGQFEGESWWERLLKEFVIRSLMYSVQVAGQLVVEMVGRIRWAPDKEN